MHILHIIDSLQLGGSERMLVNIANETINRGHQISVCVTRYTGILAEDLAPSIQLLELNRTKRFDWHAFGKLRQFIKENDVDIVHTHGRSTFSLIALLKTLRWISVPVVMHDHYGPIETDKSVPLWFRLWGKYSVGQYVGVSELLENWANKAKIPRSKINLIPNAINIDLIKAAEPLTEDALPIPDEFVAAIVVCGIRPQKGIDILIEALPDVDNMMVFVAGGVRNQVYYDNLLAQSENLNLSDKIQFLGERTDIPQVLKSVDLAIIPSRSEAGPLVLIEYMAAGLPIVATKVGNISHQAAELGLETFIPPESPAALADALNAFVRLTQDRRNIHSQKSIMLADKFFNIENIIDRWFAIYDKALK